MTVPVARTATPEDVFQMEELMRDAFEASYANFMPEQYVREFYDANGARQTVHEGLSRAAVVEIANMVAGFAMYDENVLTELWVAPMFQRKGAGRTLLEWMENRFRRLGYNSYSLCCYAPNGKALEFYKKNGFTRTSESDSTEVPGGPVKVYTLSKKLDKPTG